jgi:AraC-like DNA-binding protein
MTVASTATVTPVHRPEHSHIELSGLGETVDFLERTYGVRMPISTRRQRRATNSLLVHTRTDVGPFAIEDIQLLDDVTVSPDPLNKVVSVSVIHGRLSGHCDDIAGGATPGDITMMSQPDRPHYSQSQDLREIVVLLDPSLVAGVANGVPACRAPLPIRFLGFAPVDAAAQRLWQATVSYVKDAVLADNTFATPLVLGIAGRLLAAVTLSTFPNTAIADPTPHDRNDHQPVLLRRATEFIEANADKDIGLGDIAETVCLTPRAVQYMFRRHLDTTPLQYLRRVRLHHAHHELLDADGRHDTVTAISARWGFMHTSRFAVFYRQTYGQSPHITLGS